MRQNTHLQKTRISAVVYTHIARFLDEFKKNMGLKSRSAAIAEALADWAQECQREDRLNQALAKYGKAYETAMEWEEQRAEKMLLLIKTARRNP